MTTDKPAINLQNFAQVRLQHKFALIIFNLIVRYMFFCLLKLIMT